MIHIYQGSILDLEVDTIVNPANSFLNHAGGLAAIIAKAAAPLAHFPSADEAYNRTHEPLASIALHGQDAAWAVEQAQASLVATGNAVATSAGRLPYRRLIHAVGPVWNGGDFYEDDLLSLAYHNACALAHDEGFRSIAFPAISCGVFGFPIERAAKIAVDAVRFWATPQPNGLEMEVTFALFEDAHVKAWNYAAPEVAA